MWCRRLTAVEDAGFQEAWALYGRSFPLHEQRLLQDQARVMGHPEYHFLRVEDGGRLVGLLLCWQAPDFVYVEHLCTPEAVRGQGWGARILAYLEEQGKPVILEIDPPVAALALRRKGFYERAGFRENPHAHVYPPYRAAYAGHDLTVMSYPQVLPLEEYRAFLTYLQEVVMAA